MERIPIMSRFTLTALAMVAALLVPFPGMMAFGETPDPPAQWNGYARRTFSIAGHACFVTEPKVAAPGRPWVWRTSFPDFHAEVDLELLRSGWHVGYIDCVDMLGCDSSLDLMDQFYDQVTKERGLSIRPALEGVSRGGLHAYRYAARRPERVACIYADTPVMDLKSWPRKWQGSQKEWGDAFRYYGFKSDGEAMAFTGNPLDQLEKLAAAKIPLRHVISLTDQVVPPEDNTLEARRRLRRLGWDLDIVTVKEGTKESNGHHFPLPEAFLSARFIMRYTTVLPKGSEYFTLRDGLNNSHAKFERDKTGRVVFLGGSITAMSGWREETIRYLQQRFPETKFDFVSAGVPSLGSVPHAFRLERDVLSRGPVDLLLVEAAVNDSSNASDAVLTLRGMEGVVRHARLANPLTDIVHMHFVMPEHMNDYKHDRIPVSIAQHEKVAEAYGNTSLNLAREVTDRIAAHQFTWADDFKDLHPSPYGHGVYANSIARMLDAAYGKAASKVKEHPLPASPLDPRSFFRARLVSPEKATSLKGFKVAQDWTPTIPKETRAGYVHVPTLAGTTPGSEFEFEFEGTTAGLMIGSGPDAGIMEVSVDGGTVQKIDTFTPWSQSLYLPWAVVFPGELKPGRHTIRVRLAADHDPKSAGTALYVFNLMVN
jgi:sialidase-1